MSLLFNNLLATFREQFDTFEQLLCAPYDERDPHFLKYLAEYRGVGTVPNHSSEAALQPAERLVGFFKSVCTVAFEKLNGVLLEDVDSDLVLFEEKVNLSLLYWYGAGDKNFQFRTLVHYFDWEGLAGELFSYGGKNYCLTFFTDGFRFADAEESRQPQTASLLSATGGMDATFASEKHYFARLRTVQNQLIFLVDTWEYRNTILAVEQGEAREMAKRTKDDEFYKGALQHIESGRNQLATYTIMCFADFEEWLLQSRHIAVANETRDEWDATHALLLSGLQKIFLPGSISRHKFSTAVVSELNRWVVARKANSPHDLSAALTELLCALVLGKPADATALFLQLDAKQCLNWSLCFDALYAA